VCRTVHDVNAPPVPRHSLTWRDFRGLVERQPRPTLYRGQPDAALGLIPSLFRLPGRPNLDRYLRELLPSIHSAIAPYLDVDLDLERGPDRARFLGILRRHDFPSPLLDWTRSAEIAAYFAFADVALADIAPPDERRVTIWRLEPELASPLNVGASAAVRVLSPHAVDHPVLLSQRGMHTQSLSDQPLEVALSAFLGAHATRPALERYDFSALDAREALDDLARRGIHAGTLFPVGDPTCHRLAQELGYERQRLQL